MVSLVSLLVGYLLAYLLLPSILLNESSFGFLTSSRGLRQGDPLSPLLFIIGSEIFSRLLLREESLTNLKGIQLGPYGPSFSHLLFANDLLIFWEIDPP